ncbi:unnamed protein product [Ilex paraguariensis]|uniref:Histone-lysine N-methyltransferase ASHH2 n=1 Tax=Ilex paraguariensis TaxID=185542 RepID=A0ABC8SZS6_9AQUA
MLPQVAPIEANLFDYKEVSCTMDPECAVENFSSLEENVPDYKEGSSAMDPSCAVEKLSVSLKSCEPFCVINTDFSKSLVAPDVSGTDVLDSAFNCVHITELSGQRDNEVKDIDTVDDDFERKFSSTKCSSYRNRGMSMGRLKQNTRAKKDARNCRRTANKKAVLEVVSLKVARKRRSCISRTAHSSAWGSLGSIAHVFEQNTGLNDLDKKKKSQKDRSGPGGVKQDKNQTVRCPQRSSGKNCASTGRIRLKIKLGKEAYQNCLMDVIPVIDNVHEEYYATGIACPKLIEGIEDKLEEEVPKLSGFPCCNVNLEKTVLLSDASVSDVCLADKNVVNKSAGNIADNNHGLPSQEEVEELVVTLDNSCLDTGTSPDSEVINMVTDAQISGKTVGDLHDVLISSQEYDASGDVTSFSPSQMSSKKGNKQDKLHQAGNCSVEGKLLSPKVINSAEVVDEHRLLEKMGDGSCCSEASISTSTENASGNTSSSENFSRKSLQQSRVTDLGASCETLKVENGTKVDLCSRIGVGLESSESQISDKLPPSSNPGGRKLPNSLRSWGTANCRSDLPDSASSRGNARKQKKNPAKLVSKHKVLEKDDTSQAVCKVEGQPETGNHTSDDLADTKIVKTSSTGDICNLDVVQCSIAEQYTIPRNAWVLCDACCKWRRIPATLADSIGETNCRWTCKDNMDKDFADCSIPQEKSNADINAELEISDASCDEDARDTRINSNRLGQKQSTVVQKSSWMLIKSNLFLSRSRKSQTIDEIMVCHCKPPSDGRMGCGDGCLNRMLNIECVQRACPCGKFCSNQQFQKRKYAKLKWFRCGKKGFGLQLLEDISKGQFLIEYVGEVLDMHAYEARQKEYASKGHKHFYFMTLNGNEVIDACVKGNLGRFINHSCDPNCRTEKWMVNGEVCIGLFALRDIKKGEEVTFDYNYVRVFGAAAKKCVCGSSQCRGYIGGDPRNSEVIVQSDSDEEYPEPIMVREDGKTDENLDNVIRATSSFDGMNMQTAANSSKNEDELPEPATDFRQLETTIKMHIRENLVKWNDETDNSAAAVGRKKITTTKENAPNKFASAASKWDSAAIEDSEEQLPISVQPIVVSPQPDDVMSETMSAAQRKVSVAEKCTKNSLSVQRLEASALTTMHDKSLSDTNDTKKESKPDTEEDRNVFSKSYPRMKTSRSSSSVKKGKTKINATNANKPPNMDSRPHVLPFKSKKLLEGSLNDRFEAVQEKLNELLDSDGGISKRKDASRGYLKLLLLTAASGDNGNGEAIQSNRELSMILDALLKTKSRTVLVDVINKNGLQMLHNIMKQYRREFYKIPILRKLVKILEYLAVREILTFEHINGGPPRPGVESFKESMLTLTEHTDKKVLSIS